MNNAEISKMDALRMIDQNPLNLQFLKSFRNCEEVVLKAIEKNYMAMKFASKNLKSSKNFALKCINIEVETLEFFDKSVKRDIEVIINALTKSFMTISIIGVKAVLQDIEYVQKNIEYVDTEEQLEIKDFLLSISKARGSSIDFNYILYNHYKFMKVFQISKEIYDKLNVKSVVNEKPYDLEENVESKNVHSNKNQDNKESKRICRSLHKGKGKNLGQDKGRER